MAQTDPYRSYSFKLEIDGVVEAHFTECSGLSTKIETITYREAGDHQLVRPIPGPVDYAAVTLKYGVTKSHRLFDWMMKTAGGGGAAPGRLDRAAGQPGRERGVALEPVGCLPIRMEGRCPACQ